MILTSLSVELAALWAQQLLDRGMALGAALRVVREIDRARAVDRLAACERHGLAQPPASSDAFLLLEDAPMVAGALEYRGDRAGAQRIRAEAERDRLARHRRASLAKGSAARGEAGLMAAIPARFAGDLRGAA